MDDQPSGRGVYVVRRILAGLVILLLLALLVPQACQAFLESRDGAGSGEQDSAGVDGSGEVASEEEGAANEEIVDGADEVAGQEGTTDNRSDTSVTVASDSALRTSDDETSEDEYAGVDTIELDAGLSGAGANLEEVAIGGVDQIAPIPVFYAGGQQTIQPTAPVEPVVLVEPTAPVEPAIPVEPVIPVEPIVPVDMSVFAEPTYFGYLTYHEDPIYYEYPAYYEDPTYYDYLTYYEYPIYYEYPAYYEEQFFEEPYTLNASYDSAAFETAGEEEGGGFGAYAAIGAD